MSSSTRFFLVGCPRSGTTLLQSLISAHSYVTSFPESHFFCNLFADYEPKRRLFRMASRRIRPHAIKFFQEVNCAYPEQYFQGLIFTSQYTKAFVNALDQVTIERSKKIWLEKTPPHLHYIDYIERHVPDANFIHIVRNGADVITSIYELRNKYPDVWDGSRSDLSDCVDRWLKDISITLNHLSKPNHTWVRYESLVTDTKEVLLKVCQFMGIDFEPSMLVQYSEQAVKVSRIQETWKASVAQCIQDKKSQKFYQLLTPEQQTYVLDRLASLDLDSLLVM